MAINDEILTKQKLIEFEKVAHLNDWEESEQIINKRILGEIDWYLLDGYLWDYIKLKQKKSKKRLNDFISHFENHFENLQAINHFKMIAEEYMHGQSDKDYDDIYAEPPIITAKKVNQFITLLSIGNWDEIEEKTNHRIINKSDWELIEGLMGYYLQAILNSENQNLLPKVERSLHTFCDNMQTIELFKEVAKELNIK